MTLQAPESLELLAAALRAGTLSSRALLEQQLARIEQLDGHLNAVLWLDLPAARHAADAADRTPIASRQPLHGLPLAHKDLFGSIGHPQTAGSDFWRHHHASSTATVLERLEAAGSHQFAGLAMAEFAQNPTGHNAAMGNCLNPWSAHHISGGSSSGSAVAIAAGYTSGALGTDTGGSIRLPAACCGLTGLKPTWGRVTRAGVVPLAASLDCVGPLARTAHGCALLLAAIAGPDLRDPTAIDLPVPDYPAALTGSIAGVRVAVPQNHFLDHATPDTAAAFAAALATFTRLGATVAPITVPLDRVIAYGGVIARVEAATLHAAWMRSDPQRYATHVSGRLYPGFAIPATLYAEALTQRPAVLANFIQQAFAAADILATPTLRGQVPLWSDTDVDQGPPGTEDRFFAVGDNVRPFNYLGLPALSLPCGTDANGLPIGLQLVGRPFAEARLLRVADALQRAWGPPPLPPLSQP